MPNVSHVEIYSEHEARVSVPLRVADVELSLRGKQWGRLLLFLIMPRLDIREREAPAEATYRDTFYISCHSHKDKGHFYPLFLELYHLFVYFEVAVLQSLCTQPRAF